MSVPPNDFDSDPGRFLSNEKHVVPGWGVVSLFDGEDAEAIVASVFGAPGDTVEAATALDLPLALTKRGCLVHATKALEGNS